MMLNEIRLTLTLAEERAGAGEQILPRKVPWPRPTWASASRLWVPGSLEWSFTEPWAKASKTSVGLRHYHRCLCHEWTKEAMMNKSSVDCSFASPVTSTRDAPQISNSLQCQKLAKCLILTRLASPNLPNLPHTGTEFLDRHRTALSTMRRRSLAPSTTSSHGEPAHILYTSLRILLSQLARSTRADFQRDEDEILGHETCRSCRTQGLAPDLEPNQPAPLGSPRSQPQTE